MQFVAFVGESSPIGYAYSYRQVDPTYARPADRGPEPILHASLALAVYADEVWFLDEAFRPTRMEGFDHSRVLSPAEWDEGDLLRALQAAEGLELDEPDWEIWKDYQRGPWAIDNHGRPLRGYHGNSMSLAALRRDIGRVRHLQERHPKHAIDLVTNFATSSVLVGDHSSGYHSSWVPELLDDDLFVRSASLVRARPEFRRAREALAQDGTPPPTSIQTATAFNAADLQFGGLARFRVDSRVHGLRLTTLELDTPAVPGS